MAASPAPLRPPLRLVVANRLDALAEAADRVRAALDAWHVHPDDRADVMVILDEVGSNVVRNAWPEGGEHSFVLELSLAPDLVLLMTATDDGVAFDPTQAPAPDLDLDLGDRVPGGLGLFMVGALTERMEYARAGHENCLCLSRRVRLLPIAP